MRGIVILLVLVNLVYFGWNLLTPGQEAPDSTRILEQPAAGARLVLVSETDTDLLQEPANQVTATRNGYECFNIGEFPSLADAQQVVVFLASVEIESSLRLVADETVTEFRIYLPPFSSEGIARITLEAVNDSLLEAGMSLRPTLITSGELLNGIEFARLETSDQAIALQQQLAGMAYFAAIDEIPVIDEAIEILVRARPETQFDTQVWPRIRIQRPYLRRIENLCETIAQGGQFP